MTAIADVGEALNLLLKTPELTPKPRRWFEQIDAFRNEVAEAIQEEIDAGVGREDQLLMKSITRKLSALTRGRDIIVADVGQHQMIMARSGFTALEK
ncbi:MAG: hypothetical protein JJV98_20275 [Desulfosarcina sp.]|nr:hypothetical protein [Desulfobacterales bacterium]